MTAGIITGPATPTDRPALNDSPDKPADAPPTSVPRGRFDSATAALTALISVSVVYFFYLWPTYAYILRLADRPPVQLDGPLLALGGWSTAVLCMVPFALLATGATGLRSKRIGSALAIAILTLGLLLLAFDAMLVARYGRHLIEVIRFAGEGGSEGTGDLVGGLGGWLSLLGRGGLVIAVLVTVAWLFMQRAARAMARRSGVTWLRIARIGVVSAVGMLVIAPLFDLGFETRPAVFERLYAALPVDPRLHGREPWEPTTDDARVLAIDAELKSLYASRFAYLTRPHQVDEDVEISGDPPSVFVIVVESFRHDTLDEGMMPRLAEWSKRGLRCKRHYAGSYYSEQGLFALLYGRFPIAYNETLEAGVPPQLPHTLRRNGYELTYTTGHPEKWNGRELFMNATVFDRVIRQTEGDWPQWDRDALSAATDALQSPAPGNDRPRFVLSFLISSHFEYRYPEKYEIHKPVENTIRWEIGSIDHRDKLTAELREPLLNRYRNCMAFLDDLIMDTIERIDPAKHIVVVTGDHGESLLEDGRYGHGFAFSEMQTRVPMMIVGPGIEPRTIDRATAHADIPLTLLHALNGRPTPVRFQNGRDLLKPDAPAYDETLLCFSRNGTVGATLLASDHRLGFRLDLNEPRAVITELQNTSGDPIDLVPDSLPTPKVWRSAADRLLGSQP